MAQMTEIATPPTLLPCCAPTRLRSRILASSKEASATRRRATSGSLEYMILLESSRFLMGSEAADSIANDGEGPVRPVTLDPFYLDSCEQLITLPAVGVAYAIRASMIKGATV